MTERVSWCGRPEVAVEPSEAGTTVTDATGIVWRRTADGWRRAFRWLGHHPSVRLTATWEDLTAKGPVWRY